MQWFSLRPTFEIPIADSQQDAVRKIDQVYQQATDRKLLQVFGEYGELHLPSSEHRIWSPHLSFSVDKRSDCASIHGQASELGMLLWCGAGSFFCRSVAAFWIAVSSDRLPAGDAHGGAIHSV